MAHLTNLRGGITHAHQRSPRDPLPGQAIQIELTVGPSNTFDRGWIYWTNDGSDPKGQSGVPENGQVTELEAVASEWDTFLWGYVRRLRAEIPGQPAGTVVRYRVSVAQDSAEMLADHGTYYAFYVDDDPPPAWAQEAVIYQIFADRFFRSSKDFPTVEAKPSLKCNDSLRGLSRSSTTLRSLVRIVCG